MLKKAVLNTIMVLVVALLFINSGVFAQSTVSASIDETSLGNTVNESFVGFSFNPAYSTQYFGNLYNGNNSRTITTQLFENFKNFQKPSIRFIGANNSYWLSTNYPSPPANWNNNPTELSSTYFPSTALSWGTSPTTINQTDLGDYQGFLNQLSYQVPILFGLNTSVIDKNRTIDFVTNIKTSLSRAESIEFEIGNEPDAFESNARRTAGYSISSYLQEYTLLANAIAPFGTCAGPTLAKTNSGSWVDNIGTSFIDQASNFSTLTYHDYPLGNNNTNSNASTYLPKFLLNRYSKDVADGLKPSIMAANSRNKKFRLAEVNSIAAGGTLGASDSFGAALWAIDMMFELANAGASGCNIATEGGSTIAYSPFTYSSSFTSATNKVWVRPIYYGMLLFARAAPKAAKLVPVTYTSTVNPDQLKVWATKETNGPTRILLINRGTSLTDQSNSTLTFTLSKRNKVAKAIVLKAGSGGLAETTTVTLGNQSVNLSTGTLAEPSSTDINPTQAGLNTNYSVSIQAASAVLLEIAPNQAPTTLNLTNAVVPENTAINATVGTLSGIDPDVNETFTYSLVAGSGDTDNALFSIQADALKLNFSPNYEAKNTYTIRVRCTDFGGLSVERSIIISITNVNEAPTNLALSATSIAENSPIGTTVATLSSTDPDANDTFAYSLSGSAADNAAFSIVGSSLRLAVVPDYEAKNVYNIQIRTTDAGGLYYDKTVSIQISDVYEPPTFTLPQSNYLITVTDKTCRSTINGKINIAATQTQNYQLALLYNGVTTNYTFTSSLNIQNLAAGNYQACFTVQGQSTYQQCFTLTVGEPKELSVYSQVDIKTNSLQLSLSGSDSYTITLNGKTTYTTKTEANLALRPGKNELEVHTTKECQGSYVRTLYFNPSALIYPNPFTTDLNIELPANVGIQKIEVRALNGTLVYETLINSTSPIHTWSGNLDFLQQGTYLLRILGANLEIAQKIIKK
jgi:hypothetical protein